ncbi:hypothetical protein L6164_016757 [Bauhinia variegata]|uniref:Uncharacterized protein n=1 Tax=Bauhinia variegata TaxID=167791 RepID=A0ACB9N7B1_BAUVA|nr:hypothetical protein L6164_016757 [Bauhinia variegata]
MEFVEHSEAKQDHFGSDVLHNATENRRSANYKPNIWKYDFLQSLTSKYHNEEYGLRLDQRIHCVKEIFVEEKRGLAKLELVDRIQKLGLARHFQKEIKEVLDKILSTQNSISSIEENRYLPALSFKLLRQHGYKVSPDTVSTFLADNGKVPENISEGSVKDILEILECSHLAFEGENILEKAKTLALSSLNCASEQMYGDLLEEVVHAVELPSHWRVQWFDIKWYINHYEKQHHMDATLLNLAKLNFNIIQANHQDEVKELSGWWKILGLKEHLNFARDRLVECFMCAVGVASEPRYRSFRKWLTKAIKLVLVIDDVYDIYATFNELKHFTVAVEKWDDNEVQQLPKYMRICFQALNDITNETAFEIEREKNLALALVLPHLKKVVMDGLLQIIICRGKVVQRELYTIIARISKQCLDFIIRPNHSNSFFAIMHEVTEGLGEFLNRNHDLIYNESLIIRLCNDLGTGVAERERGDAASSILCYMNEMSVSEEEARNHIKWMIRETWKKINEECFTKMCSSRTFVSLTTNAARVAHTLYQNGDGFGIQDRDIGRQILSLVIEPFLEV